MTVALLVLWPMPMFGTKYVFSKGFFTGECYIPNMLIRNRTNDVTGWVVVGIVWIFFSMLCVGIFPVWQGRKTAAHTIKSMFLDLTGKKRPMLHGRMEEVSEDSESGTATPQEKVAVKSG